MAPSVNLEDSATPIRVDYLFNDALHSVCGVTDKSCVVTERLFFEPFGKRIKADGSTFDGTADKLKSGFTGHEHDYEFG